jgi:hypothetical protein
MSAAQSRRLQDLLSVVVGRIETNNIDLKPSGARPSESGGRRPHLHRLFLEPTRPQLMSQVKWVAPSPQSITLPRLSHGFAVTFIWVECHDLAMACSPAAYYTSPQRSICTSSDVKLKVNINPTWNSGPNEADSIS